VPRTRQLAVAGTAALLVFMLSQFPAATAFAWFAPAGSGGFGFQGTIWNGSARLISVGGQQLRNTRWELSVWRLFTGRLAGDIETRWAGGFIEGWASVSVTGAIDMREVRGSFDIAPLSPLLGLPQAGGIATLDLSEVAVRDSWPQRLIGTGEVRNLSSPLMGSGEAQVIGDIGISFDTATETDADTITGLLNDTGGPLELSGTLLLTPPGNYELRSRVRARRGAPEALRRNLNFLGAPEPDGTHIFQIAGSI